MARKGRHPVTPDARGPRQPGAILQAQSMTPAEATRIVQEQYPFYDFLAVRKDACLNIAETVSRHLPRGSTILDFASGTGAKAAVLQTLGFECTAFDDLQDHWHAIDGNREKILGFMDAFGIGFELARGGTLPFDRHSFDMLMMNAILEHLHDSPRVLLNDLLELVKPEGLFFATVPNLANIRKRLSLLLGRSLASFHEYYWCPGPWRGHVREYVKDDLVELCEHLGLRILELRSCHHMLASLRVIPRPAYLAMTRIFTGWRDSWLLVAQKPPNWAPVRERSADGN